MHLEKARKFEAVTNILNAACPGLSPAISALNCAEMAGDEPKQPA